MLQLDAAHKALIDWFKSNQADLPWRRGRDPYRVWLSEIMLQQTQVETVIPYFERFLHQFPDIASLAAASLDQVLKAWEGLGYYSRARHLHQVARLLVEQFDGQLPSTVAELMKLPGIGRYTAGAIASLAFGEDAPLLDGNVIRVLSRLLNLAGDVSSSAVRRSLWQTAEALVPPGKAGLWNEGLMELGRRICTPRHPDCSHCPVKDYCLARQEGVQEQRPVKTRRQPLPHYEVAAAIIRDRKGQILIAQRPIDKMLGGLWEFPGGKRERGETLTDCVQREIAEELGIQIEVGPQFAVVKHSFTHFKMTMTVYLCDYVSGAPQAIGCSAWAWIALDAFDRYAFPATDRKIIQALQNGQPSGLSV
jgi:A/G-specific adenine glycosylase